MKNTNPLLTGAEQFNKTASESVKPLLERLAREGQTPHSLFLTCADSRIDPLYITQTEPGDLFLLRNIGNIVPLASSGDSSVMATVEYAVGALGVETIVVCGHSDCGAMHAVLSKKDLTALPHVKSWLANAEQTTVAFGGEEQLHFAPDLPEVDKLSQVNVVTQFENLRTYPVVQDGMDAGTLRLVGMWFDIANACVSVYDEANKEFKPA